MAGHDIPHERLLMAEPLVVFLQQLCLLRRQQACPSSGELMARSATGYTHKNNSQTARLAARTRIPAVVK
jgi:hypothetical protein